MRDREGIAQRRSAWPLSASFALALVALGSALPAEEGSRITFLPPPLEGTLSVGIYSIDGKLVRVLAKEAQPDAFIIGLNGLITTWDGKDDAGTVVAAGKYFVRGYSVGEMEIEGLAFHGNDWFQEDDSLQIRDLTALQIEGRELHVDVIDAGGQKGVLRMDLEGGSHTFAASETSRGPTREALGPQGAVWRIEEGGLVQHKGDEVLRLLPIGATDPKPFAVAAAPDRDELFLLERDEHGVQLRGLRLKTTKTEVDGKAISEWEVFLEKRIAAQDTFAQALPALHRPEPPVAEEKVRIALIPNELLQVAPAALNVSVAVDESGSFLRTSDGLPLRRLTDTTHLKWAVLTRQRDHSVTLLQSNGAVIEEFGLRKLDQMMAFDAGEYEWTGGK